MGQKAGIKFCVKLKKTATETSEMLESVYGEEQVCLKGIIGSKKGKTIKIISFIPPSVINYICVYNRLYMFRLVTTILRRHINIVRKPPLHDENYIK
jgi:hypothetical protein